MDTLIVTDRHQDRARIGHALREGFAPVKRRSLVATMDSMLSSFARALQRDAASDIAVMPTNLDPSFLLGAQFSSFAAKVPGMKEVVREPLYSFKAYATGGQVQLTHFDQTFGQATNGWGDTNMSVASTLPAGEGFLVTNIRAVPRPAQADYDTAAAGTPVAFGQWNEVYMGDCWLEFWILQKPYIRVGPLAMFPAGFGPGAIVAGAATVLRNVSYPSFGTPETNSLFLIDPPLLLQPMDNFFAASRWQAVKTVTTAGKHGIVLDGYKIRNVQ